MEMWVITWFKTSEFVLDNNLDFQKKCTFCYMGLEFCPVLELTNFSE